MDDIFIFLYIVNIFLTRYQTLFHIIIYVRKKVYKVVGYRIYV